jgi:RNA polymerase sigma factor (sigma-70 family)
MPEGFPTTQWSALLGARSDDDGERRRSWTTLVGAYWKPAYKHVRIKWGKPREDAEDLLQGFFERAMSKEFFARYEPDRARFRTFFRVCLDRFVANEEKARTRQKRGGGLSLDFDAAESELGRMGASGSPEELFDREWRRSLFAIAIDALGEQCKKGGKETAYRIFCRYDLSEASERPSYETIARDLELPVTTVTNQLAWARRELRQIVLEKLGEVTASKRELVDEARTLLGPRS